MAAFDLIEVCMASPLSVDIASLLFIFGPECDLEYVVENERLCPNTERCFPIRSSSSALACMKSCLASMLRRAVVTPLRRSSWIRRLCSFSLSSCTLASRLNSSPDGGFKESRYSWWVLCEVEVSEEGLVALGGAGDDGGVSGRDPGFEVGFCGIDDDRLCEGDGNVVVRSASCLSAILLPLFSH